MLLITCPVTKTDELVADRRIRSVVNHPTHIALTIECPCGATHVYRTGRRWEEARRTVAARREAAALHGTTAQPEPADARRADELIPA